MCNSCETLRINGMVCHEIGCPDAWRDYTIECKWCGQKFKPETKGIPFCCHTCMTSYYNISCDCEDCTTTTN